MKYRKNVIFLLLFPQVLFSEIIYFPKEIEPGGLFGLKFGMFSFRAKLETEFVAPQGSEILAYSKGSQNIFHQNNTKTNFKIDQFTLSPQVDLRDKARFYSELEFRTSRAEIDVVFLREAHFSLFMKELFLKIGLDKRFMSPGSDPRGAIFEDRRLTETYPINGIAFWKDEHLGITLGGDHVFGPSSHVYWMASLTNGLALGHEELTRNRIYPIIHDDRDVRSSNVDLTGGYKEMAWGIGLKHAFSEKNASNTHVFLFNSNLAARDIEFLMDVLPRYSSRSDKRYRLGLNQELTFSNLNFFGQYIYAKDGLLERQGFYVQPSLLLFERPGKELLNSGVRFLYRFNVLDINVGGRGSNASKHPLTWDRHTHTAAINIHLHPYVLWRNEYNINQEKTGHPNLRGVDNNEFLTQLVFKF